MPALSGPAGAMPLPGSAPVAGAPATGSADALAGPAGAAVCVIGEAVRRQIYGGSNGQTGLDEQLRAKKFWCDVIGILASKGQGGRGDQDDTAVVPLRTLQRRVSGTRKVGTLPVAMQEGSGSAPLLASLRGCCASAASWPRPTTTSSTSSPPSNPPKHGPARPRC